MQVRTVKRAQFTDNERRRILAEAGIAPIRTVCKNNRISFSTFYRWRSRLENYIPIAARLMDLECENPRGLENRQTTRQEKPGETVAGKQRTFGPNFPIGPLPHFSHQWEKRLNTHTCEAVPHHFFVARTRVDSIPVEIGAETFFH